MKIKFENGSYIKSIDSAKVYRSSRYKTQGIDYCKYPDRFLEDFFGQKFNLIDRLILRWKLRPFDWIDRLQQNFKR